MDEYDAYHLWLGIPPDEQPPSHYRLLGVRLFEQNGEVIRNAADRQRSHVKRLGVNQFQKVGQDLLNEIESAKICLLRPEKRQAYDERLRRELQRRSATGDSSSYEQQLGEVTLIVGSDPNCDIVIDLPIISGIHCSVMRREDSIILRDLKSTNGTFLNFNRVKQPTKISHEDLIILGRETRLKLPIAFFPIAQRNKRVVFLGRSDQCEISIDDNTVSGFHACIIFDGSEIKVLDLDSTNGTYLVDGNGKSTKLRSKTATSIDKYNEIVVGKHRISVAEIASRNNSLDATWTED